MNKNKSQLIEENEQLKSLLKEANDKLKKLPESGLTSISDDLDQTGVSLVKIGKKFHLVELAFNIGTKKAEVVKIEEASRLPEALHMAQLEFKKFSEEKIIDKAIKS